MPTISPSILASDFSILADEIRSLEAAGADMIHIDVMDGHFVPNITLGPPIIQSLRAHTALPFDVHLMIENPLFFIDSFADAGANLLTFHLEAASDPEATIKKIKSRGCKASLSIKPNTPAEAVFPYLEDLDMVLVMTVEPGFGGQRFLPDCLEKIELLRKEAQRRSLQPLLQVDGGINEETALLCAQKGADCFVAGSFVFRAANRRGAIDSLRQAANLS